MRCDRSYNTVGSEWSMIDNLYNYICQWSVISLTLWMTPKKKVEQANFSFNLCQAALPLYVWYSKFVIIIVFIYPSGNFAICLVMSTKITKNQPKSITKIIQINAFRNMPFSNFMQCLSAWHTHLFASLKWKYCDVLQHKRPVDEYSKATWAACSRLS